MGWISNMYVIRFQGVMNYGGINVLRSKEHLQLSHRQLGKPSLARYLEP